MVQKQLFSQLGNSRTFHQSKDKDANSSLLSSPSEILACSCSLPAYHIPIPATSTKKCLKKSSIPAGCGQEECSASLAQAISVVNLQLLTVLAT